MKIKNKTAGHAGIACFSFALKGNRAGSPHFKIVRFKWWEHVTHRKIKKMEVKYYVCNHCGNIIEMVKVTPIFVASVAP